MNACPAFSMFCFFPCLLYSCLSHSSSRHVNICTTRFLEGGLRKAFPMVRIVGEEGDVGEDSGDESAGSEGYTKASLDGLPDLSCLDAVWPSDKDVMLPSNEVRHQFSFPSRSESGMNTDCDTLIHSSPVQDNVHECLLYLIF
jgi:hypothetical protein